MKIEFSQVVVMKAFNPSIQRQKQTYLWVQVQSGVQSEFQDIQSCIENPVSNKRKEEKEERK